MTPTDHAVRLFQAERQLPLFDVSVEANRGPGQPIQIFLVQAFEVMGWFKIEHVAVYFDLRPVGDSMPYSRFCISKIT